MPRQESIFLKTCLRSCFQCKNPVLLSCLKFVCQEPCLLTFVDLFGTSFFVNDIETRQETAPRVITPAKNQQLTVAICLFSLKQQIQSLPLSKINFLQVCLLFSFKFWKKSLSQVANLLDAFSGWVNPKYFEFWFLTRSFASRFKLRYAHSFLPRSKRTINWPRSPHGLNLISGSGACKRLLK